MHWTWCHWITMLNVVNLIRLQYQFFLYKESNVYCRIEFAFASWCILMIITTSRHFWSVGFTGKKWRMEDMVKWMEVDSKHLYCYFICNINSIQPVRKDGETNMQIIWHWNIGSHLWHVSHVIQIGMWPLCMWTSL